MNVDNEVSTAARALIKEHGREEAARIAILYYRDHATGGDPEMIDYWRAVVRAIG